jgi:hypothetical protein
LKNACAGTGGGIETYVKVKGEWKYLYRAVSAQGDTRSISAATIFIKKALRATAASRPPESITTDKNPTYRAALARINAERTPAPPLRHRDVKYLNNVIEADHGKLKRLVKPTLGFKSMKTAYATLKGFEVMRMFRKGEFACWYPGEGVREKCASSTGNLAFTRRDVVPNILSQTLTSRRFFCNRAEITLRR